MSTINLVVIFFGTLCLVEFLAIGFLYRNYKELLEEIILFHHPDMILPKYRNEMQEKIREDKKVQEERQKSQDFFNLVKTGECNEDDVKYFGVNIDG